LELIENSDCKNIFATSKFMVAPIVVDTPFIRPDQSPLLQ